MVRHDTPPFITFGESVEAVQPALMALEVDIVNIVENVHLPDASTGKDENTNDDEIAFLDATWSKFRRIACEQSAVSPQQVREMRRYLENAIYMIEAEDRKRTLSKTWRGKSSITMYYQPLRK